MRRCASEKSGAWPSLIERLKRGGFGESWAWGDDDSLPVGRTGERGEQELATVHASLPPPSTLQLIGGGALTR